MSTSAARADRRAAAAIAVTASAIAVLPPEPRAAGACAIAAIPLVAWLLSGPLPPLAVFLAALLLLPPLPVSFGNSGPHPALIAAAIGIYAGLLHARRWAFLNTPVVLPASVLAVVMLASVPMALVWSGPEIAVGSAARVLLFALAPATLAYVACGPGRVLRNAGMQPAKLLFAAGALSAAFACVDFFLQLPAPGGYSPQFIWLSDRILRRAQGVFYDAGALGNLCAFLMVFVAACFLIPGRSPVNRWLLAAGAAPVTAALLLSFSRAALLNAAGGIVALVCLRHRDVRWLRIAAVPVIVIAAAGTLYWFSPALAYSWWARLQRTVQFSFSATDLAVSGRLTSWQTIAAFCQEHPLAVVFGVGYKTLAYSDVAGRPVIADNTYLSTLIETGIAGLAALWALHASILRAMFQRARSADATAAFYGAWAFAFWIGEMVQMMAADLLTYYRLLPVFFFVMAMALLRRAEAAP